MTFDEFAEHWTGRDKAYHDRYGTVGLDFARACWDAAIKQEREACAAECDRLTWAIDHGGNKYRRPAEADKCAAAIRKRSNV